MPRQPGTQRGPAIAAGPNAGSTSDSQPLQAPRDLSAQVQALAYNATGTTAEEAEVARQSWIGSIQAEAAANLAVAEPIEIPVTYEGRICLSPEPVNGLIGVWVRPDGTLGSDPVLLKSTGYGLLNEQAASAIAALQFPESETSVAHEIRILVEHDSESCIDREQILKSRGAAAE